MTDTPSDTQPATPPVTTVDRFLSLAKTNPLLALALAFVVGNGSGFGGGEMVDQLTGAPTVDQIAGPPPLPVPSACPDSGTDAIVCAAALSACNGKVDGLVTAVQALHASSPE